MTLRGIQTFSTTMLQDFCHQQILLTGFRVCPDLKIGRNEIIRSRFDGPYLSYFVKIFNELPAHTRKALIEKKTLDQKKAYLKKLRKLEYDLEIHKKYKWVPFKNV